MANKLYVYEVIVCDKEGNNIDSVYFNSHKAAKMYKPFVGHVTAIAQWNVLTSKDLVNQC